MTTQQHHSGGVGSPRIGSDERITLGLRPVRFALRALVGVTLSFAIVVAQLTAALADNLISDGDGFARTRTRTSRSARCAPVPPSRGWFRSPSCAKVRGRD
jgi:hypothetical protein